MIKDETLSHIFAQKSLEILMDSLSTILNDSFFKSSLLYDFDILFYTYKGETAFLSNPGDTVIISVSDNASVFMLTDEGVHRFRLIGW
jgi:predicted transcriptional regulator